MSIEKYDAVVIGAGPAGYEASIKLSKSGLKTLLIEKAKEQIGGVCLNEGCIPAKTYLQSSELFFKTKWSKQLGIDLTINGFNLSKLKNRSEELKQELRVGVSWLLDQAGVDCLYGKAIFKSNKELIVDDKIIEFDKCIIATGSVVREDKILPIDGRYIISSSDVFKLEKLPSSLTIIGSGAIACEFATFFNALGVDVTMIIKSEFLLSKQDIDISKALMREFKKRGIKIVTSSKVQSTQIKNEKIILETDQETDLAFETDLVLLAIGRVPNTKDLALENTDIKIDEKGFLNVDSSFQTNQKGVYAIGDCINTQAYAHVAHREAHIAANNIINNQDETNSSIVPTVVFTIPQIASCGINEKETNKKGYEIVIKKNYFKASAKAKILGDDSGFIKVIVCAKSDEILGASIIGIDASEIIHNLTIAIQKKMEFKEIKELIFAHPTISEIVASLD